MKAQRTFFGAFLLALAFGFALPVLAAEGPVEFNRDIRPILSDKCFQCHGPDSGNRQADLRFDVEASAKADRDGYHVILPGQPSESELVRRISSTDDFERMPPPEAGKELSSDEIELLTKWIAQGAEWEPAWNYVPPRKSLPPAVSDAAWCRNWIDRFILSRLEAVNRSPAPATDAVTLLRRVSFDLTGLPPSAEQVERFAANPSDAMYEQIVNELLASPHFGERMAMIWLDLVRFADTVGYHGDQTQNIWPYRDYVIYSFNENKPFDQFTIEQLAGDLLPDPTDDQLVATGYNRLLQTSHEEGVQVKEYRAMYMSDRVRNLSNVWMGATVGCAQCHDHKFDPYRIDDFYALGAFFADVDDEHHLTVVAKRGNGNRLPTIREPEIEVQGIYERLRQEAQHDQIPATEAAESAELQSDQAKPVAKRPHTLITKAITPRTTRVLPRGNWQDESGPIVEPAVPEFLGEIEFEGERPSRLDLARWLTSAENGVGGLTARVMVNRYWYFCFGAGLARVLDDFGGQGLPPTHPKLLDNLAVEYLESGWDTKHLLKLIVTSSAYRQGSQTTEQLRNEDPLNHLISRQARFRLPAEMVRDSALAISGLLNPELGGPSIRPYQPAGHYHNLNFPARRYKPSRGPAQWKRSVYMHWQRQFLHPMLAALDAPSREECTAERQRSNTALAALTLLNDPIFVEAARVLAAELLEDSHADDIERLDQAYFKAVSHVPDAESTAALIDLLGQSREFYQEHPKDAEQLVSVGAASAGHPPQAAEWAAWTIVCRAILNLSETTTRN